jgi:DNA-binding transcriptional regulator of glucitol operon
LGKPFELGAFFQGADEGAFGDNADAEMAMDDNEEVQPEMDMDESA